MKGRKFTYVLKSKKLSAIVLGVVLASVISLNKVYASPVITRYDGMDRYETAAKVCEDGWKSGSDYAVIVSGDNFPDALSAAPLAKKYDAPILLTNRDVLNPYTSSELGRLKVKTVYIIGGKGVVSQSIQDALSARGIKVTRIGGADRYETSIAVANALGKSKEIAVVNGDEFQDGMSIAPIAALKGMPIVLTERSYIPGVVQKYLKSNSKVDQTYVIGGSSEISSSIIGSFYSAKRIGDGDVYSRNTGVINAFQNEISTGTLYVASAKDFPDSLVAAAIAPKTKSPVLFVSDYIPQTVQNFLRSSIVDNLKILGGLGSIDYNTQENIAYLPISVSSTDSITDTIWQGDKYNLRPTIVVTASDGSIKEVPVTWNVSKINTSKPGIYTLNGKVDGMDQDVTMTLIVKPLPTKIDDITATSQSESDYSLPETVSAKMSDGTISRIPVIWEYGVQQGNKPGVYVFQGTVDHYSKKVKLTLTVTVPPQIESIPGIKLKLQNFSDFYSSVYYTNVPAKMSDGTIKQVPIIWNMNSKTDYPGYPGVYELTGRVSDYDQDIKAIIITGNAEDPTPGDPTTPDNPGQAGGTLVELPDIDIMEGDNSYNLPKNVTDPSTGKNVPVTWTTSNIDAANISTDSVETSRVSLITFIGTSAATDDRFELKANVRPMIAGISEDSLNVTISASDYYNRSYSLPSTLKAVMKDGVTTKNISVVNWDKPYITISAGQTYKIKGTVKWYNTPVTFTLTVEP